MIRLPDKCLRDCTDCIPMAQIEADSGSSFVCCGENDGTTRKEPQDLYTFCFKNTEIDEISHYDEVDLADQSSVIAQSLSIINHKRVNIDLYEENRKLKSMCKAAASEIDEHWQAHCNDEGYGPSNLVSRLSGKLKPDLYPGFDD